ncbi:glycosyltransferase family 2 protein [Planococcus sp. X10-3]|uniref:glycosyltransferase family 2 protein n=1 Tax=Planococcus sp. X10-3 TaxID=3061240 RepID=UPI003BB20C10
MESKVSVIIPTYKGAGNLPRAIDSIIDQTYNNVEVIVVDDNDPDTNGRRQTEAAMQSYRQYGNVKYIKHSMNKNGAAARNTGLAASSGEFICFLDDDDFYLQDRIEKCLNLLLASPRYEGIYCGVVITNKGNFDRILKPESPLEQRDLLLDGDRLGTGSNLFLSRKAVQFVEGFDETFIRHQDLEFMLRVLEHFKVLNLAEILIVKATNGVNNVPDYGKLRKVKELYMLKFENAIERLSPADRNRFYVRQYEELFYAALKSGKKEFIVQSLRELKLFRDITFKDRMLVMISEKRLSKKRVYKTLRPVYDSSKNRAVSNQLQKHLDASAKERIFNVLGRMNSNTKA